LSRWLNLDPISDAEVRRRRILRDWDQYEPTGFVSKRPSPVFLALNAGFNPALSNARQMNPTLARPPLEPLPKTIEKSPH
jgi:hypothetical protein